MTRPVLRTRRLRVVFPALLLVGVTVTVQTRAARRAEQKALIPTVATPQFHPALCRMAHDRLPLELDAADVPVAVALEQGSTLGGLLADLGLEAREANAALTALADHVDVRRIRAGAIGLAYLDEGARLAALRLDRGDGWVELSHSGDGWRSRFHAFERRTEQRRITGTIEGSLEGAMRTAGGEATVAYRMADVLQWDLDFNRDLRAGDRFAVLYQETYLDGTYAGTGLVDALVFENRGVRLEAYRFEDAYYDADGRPLQKMFLRSPLPFTRVTSKFSRARFHPVLKVTRPHYGVDYGAPTGTPVRVTAHGVVTFVGRSGGAGKMIKVRHPNGFLSAYLHLSRYAKGLRSGARVRQGDVIGFVGSTGLSTGPHLDYRVQKNGRWIDPLGLQQTPAEPIPDDRLPAFLAARDALRRALAYEADDRIRLAEVYAEQHSAGPASAR